MERKGERRETYQMCNQKVSDFRSWLYPIKIVWQYWNIGLLESGYFRSNQDNPYDDRKGRAGDRKGAAANDRYCPI